MTCTILELKQPAPRNDGPTLPPALCKFCGNPSAAYGCDEPFGLTLSDLGRATAHETPLIRQAHRQAARNGNSSVCNVLEGIHPALTDTFTEELCPTCGSDTPDFCECELEPMNRVLTGEPFGPSTWDADDVKNFHDYRFEN